MDPNWTR